jgi:cyclopropane fatty-acyl-phospholipid synthase-like methyltransferase
MLTISREQYAYLSEWCATHTLPGRAKVVYQSIFDYEPAERYDAIVLLGVMEHLPNYPALFRKFEALLKPRGRLYVDFAAGRRKFDVSAFTTGTSFRVITPPWSCPSSWLPSTARPSSQSRCTTTATATS